MQIERGWKSGAREAERWVIRDWRLVQSTSGLGHVLTNLHSPVPKLQTRSEFHSIRYRQAASSKERLDIGILAVEVSEHRHRIGAEAARENLRA